MNFIYTAIMGLLAGLIAKYVMPGEEPGGLLVTMLIGIAGSFVGNFLFGLIGMNAGGTVYSLFVSVIGALVLLYVWKKFIAPKMK